MRGNTSECLEKDNQIYAASVLSGNPSQRPIDQRCPREGLRRKFQGPHCRDYQFKEEEGVRAYQEKGSVNAKFFEEVKTVSAVKFGKAHSRNRTEGIHFLHTGISSCGARYDHGNKGRTTRASGIGADSRREMGDGGQWGNWSTRSVGSPRSLVPGSGGPRMLKGWTPLL